MFDAQRKIRERYPEGREINQMEEIYCNDQFSLAILGYFSRKIPKIILRDKNNLSILISFILTCYFSILQREIYISPLVQDNNIESLMESLKYAGLDFPQILQDRVVKSAPVDELINTFSDDYMNWGDIMIVQLMGKIGDSKFIPELLKIVKETEGLSYIHEDAIKAINAIEESGHEEILAFLKAGNLQDDIDRVTLLEHLPYPEAFDLAELMWEEDEVDSFELFADCVTGIGDERGIKLLQKVFSETGASPIGDSLEILSLLYDRNIPEIKYIRERRKDQEKQQQKVQELNEIASKYNKTGSYTKKPQSTVITLPQAQKIGRNAPCPCGSGKKYKKCCLSKHEK